MTTARRILLWIIVAVIVLIAVVILFIATFDWNRARPWFNQNMSNAIGRPFTINGNLTVHWARNTAEGGLAAWVPWPRFIARDISIANPDWARQKQFATLQQIQFSLSPLALLGHEIKMPSLQLGAPRIDIERDKQDRDNWTFQFDQTPSAWKLEIGDVIFDKGAVRVDDEKSDLHLDIAVDPLGKPVPYDQIVAPKDVSDKSTPVATTDQAYYFGWTAKGTYRGADATGSGKIGSVLAVQNASLPFPLQASLKLRDLHIAFAGTLTDPAHLAAFNLRLKMSGANLAHLYPLTGLALPNTPPFTTDGHLTGQLHRHDSVFHYNQFNGKVGASDLHGSVTFTTAPPRPKLSGTLTSNLLKLSDLATLIGADSNAQKAQRGADVKQPADKLLPVETFDTDRWRAMDADVKFSGERIERKAALPINDLTTRVRMDDGVLTLNPLRFGVAGGDLDANIRLDGRADPIKGKMKLSARSLQLKKLFPTVELMKSSTGDVNGDVALSATGDSVAKLLGDSNGEVKLLVNGGTVSDTLMEEAGLNLANVVIDKLFGDKTVQINCAAADFVARDGVLDSRLFVFDTGDSIIQIDGTINLATEQLDLTLHPHSKGIRILSLRSPLYVRGTLKHPDAGVEKGPLLARAAGALALGTVAAPLAALAALIAPSHKDQNQCASVIAQMQQSKPTAPPPGKTMPAKSKLAQPSQQ